MCACVLDMKTCRRKYKIINTLRRTPIHTHAHISDSRHWFVDYFFFSYFANTLLCILDEACLICTVNSIWNGFSRTLWILLVIGFMPVYSKSEQKWRIHVALKQKIQRTKTKNKIGNCDKKNANTKIVRFYEFTEKYHTAYAWQSISPVLGLLYIQYYLFECIDYLIPIGPHNSALVHIPKVWKYSIFNLMRITLFGLFNSE